MPRMSKLEWEVIRDCLIFQECNEVEGRPWGHSNNTELTDWQREKRDDAMKSALEKLKD
jgi:hypothetical protein